MKRKLINDNLDEVIRIIFRYFGYSFDRYAANLYHSHPRYGHIEAIAYILSRFGIDSSLVSTDIEELNSFPYPLIINYDGLYLPIIGVDSDRSFIILNESGGNENVTLDEIDSFWDKRALVLQKDDKGKGNENRERIIGALKRATTILSGLIVAAVFVFFSVKTFIFHSLIRDCYLISSILGLTVSVLFHIQRLNRGNPLINKICHSSANHSSKRDCSSILDSTASKFLGLISWVDIGSVYFIVFLLVLWTIWTTEAMTFLAIVSLCSSLYIPYSIYYQAKIAKRWCALCLSIQAILFFNALVSVPFLIKENLIVSNLLTDVVVITAVALVTIPLYSLVIIVLNSYFLVKNRDRKHREWIFSPEIIHQLIYEIPETDFTSSSKIPVINRDGNAELIMIINPLCSPCMKETREVLEIINRKRYTSLSIIFLVDPKADEQVTQAKMLISESLMGDLAKALDEHAKRFPKKCEPESTMSCHQDSQRILDSHFKWCISNKVLSTPKLFINNHELSSIYSVKDIDFLIE